MKEIFLFLLMLIALNIVTADRTRDCSNYNKQISKDISTGKKMFVNCLAKDVESGQSDLVVLIDKSGSMWNTGTYKGKSMNGFEVAKQFVKSLLSEVRIAYNATRIAVGTFNAFHKIDFNYILNPTFKNQKCQFNHDFSKLTLTGGATNIRGALQDGLNVMNELMYNNPHKHDLRDKANKVVLLLTDGHGNFYKGQWSNEGRDATPEADNIKRGHRTLFTVAVTPGSDQVLLKKWASHPTAYLYASSFNEMLTLAHNIRGGLFLSFHLRNCLNIPLFKLCFWLSFSCE